MLECCLPCLREIEEEGKIYSLVLENINEIILKEEITSQDIEKLVSKLNSYNPPLTRLTKLASTQILAYEKKLKDSNQPIDLIKTELETIKKYIEPAIEASREILELARKREISRIQ